MLWRITVPIEFWEVCSVAEIDERCITLSPPIPLICDKILEPTKTKSSCNYIMAEWLVIRTEAMSIHHKHNDLMVCLSNPPGLDITPHYQLHVPLDWCKTMLSLFCVSLYGRRTTVSSIHPFKVSLLSEQTRPLSWLCKTVVPYRLSLFQYNPPSLSHQSRRVPSMFLIFDSQLTLSLHCLCMILSRNTEIRIRKLGLRLWDRHCVYCLVQNARQEIGLTLDIQRSRQQRYNRDLDTIHGNTKQETTQWNTKYISIKKWEFS